jgi:hypothetical protein
LRLKREREVSGVRIHAPGHEPDGENADNLGRVVVVAYGHMCLTVRIFSCRNDILLPMTKKWYDGEDSYPMTYAKTVTML